MNKTLTKEEYIDLKTETYKLIKSILQLKKENSNISISSLINFIDNMKPSDVESGMIYISTILIPDDYSFSQNVEMNVRTDKLSKLYGNSYPIGVYTSKVMEMKKYELAKLIKDREIDSTLASCSEDVFEKKYLRLWDKASDEEIRDKKTINDFILTYTSKYKK